MKTPLLKLADPAMPTEPTSWCSHGLGRVPPPDPAPVVNDWFDVDAVMLANVRETIFQ